MCGIAGFMRANAGGAADAAWAGRERMLERFAEALAHRGPDGSGRHLDDHLAMVQTRLAVIDLETGDQPMYATSQAGSRLALVANAEIYNYVELRAAMPEADFQTRSDCETALHLYRQHGADFANGLRGMYAIAIRDPGTNGGAGSLVLARDPFGIKPLYYTQSGSGFAFASEPQALIAADLVTPELCPRSREELLQLQFTTGRETAIRGIQRVLPGETLVVEDGRIVREIRRCAIPAGPPEEMNEDEALERLRRALIDSVNVHQRSDVSYGMFLSGGIDSSTVLALMRELNEAPVRAFTIGFDDPGATDERDHARSVAAAAGAAFEAVGFAEDDFWQLLPAIASALDDPVADYAVLPTFMLARFARERGIKVVLTGEGGDEMFAGYGRYRRALRHRIFGGRTMRAAGAFDRLDVLSCRPVAWRDGVAAAEKASATHARTRLQALQAADCQEWLPNDLLTKLDRCLMAFGVEGRTPFLDPDVARMAFRLPDRLKVRGRMGKWILRRWLADALPEAKPYTTKRGFTVPVGAWIARRGARLGPLVATQPGVAEIGRRENVIRLFAEAGARREHAAWRLLFYALWHDRHILGRQPRGDVFETLAEAA
jgi:asparagine synthase (glutamine-hydrolysing)